MLHKAAMSQSSQYRQKAPSAQNPPGTMQPRSHFCYTLCVLRFVISRPFLAGASLFLFAKGSCHEHHLSGQWPDRTQSIRP